jgi:hypothetical protein
LIGQIPGAVAEFTGQLVKGADWEDAERARVFAALNHLFAAADGSQDTQARLWKAAVFARENSPAADMSLSPAQMIAKYVDRWSAAAQRRSHR